MSNGLDALKAMQVAYEALEPLDGAHRARAVQWLVGELGIAGDDYAGVSPEATPVSTTKVSTPVVTEPTTVVDTPPSPREFMAEKRPQSAVERVACLAFYLRHYRATETFRTRDVTELNTEAAGPRLTPDDVGNADRNSGFIVAAGPRSKQITIRGEALVLALPDREAVKQGLAEHPHRRKRTGKSTMKSTAAAEDP